MDGADLRNRSVAAPVPAVFFRQVSDRRERCTVTNDRLASEANTGLRRRRRKTVRLGSPPPAALKND